MNYVRKKRSFDLVIAKFRRLSFDFQVELVLFAKFSLIIEESNFKPCHCRTKPLS